ncbi:uncharacterized protein LTR77_007821 [Saxophila tyrrhenica]|uniref:Citrate transporter-like domain-containing protein n=1 Tax=Saxophila tyrrhenica TaxID=1690608 RepID=A0AAV9P3X8_9PEZI|nr:hypothetical protein LTR77_007821 [Saxophila tyrrhenica]
MASGTSSDLDTSRIKDWRSILTLIVFVLTNVLVLFPIAIPFWIPRSLRNITLSTLARLRIIPPPSRPDSIEWQEDGTVKSPDFFIRYSFPINFVTAPLIADLFLLATLSIGREEVHDGTVGSDGISPIDIMAFFITLAYIAISIDASGLIRYLAFKVLQKGGEKGQLLFCYLYVFFFGLAGFIGNDPIILSGTAFLAYMTRVSENIEHPRAWIHTQFAVANIGSAILVSSNPTNLVIAGAFGIKFIVYTANMIVPVITTALLMLPFLLYVVFPYESLIPQSIKLHELPAEARDKQPVNPNIPFARGKDEEEEQEGQGQGVSLEEVMNPFLDKKGAGVGAAIMAVTLITILVLNAVDNSHGHTNPVFWVTAPAAFILLCWDIATGWRGRHETREIAREGRQAFEEARAQRRASLAVGLGTDPDSMELNRLPTVTLSQSPGDGSEQHRASADASGSDYAVAISPNSSIDTSPRQSEQIQRLPETESEKGPFSAVHISECRQEDHKRMTLVSLLQNRLRWSQETFPSFMAVCSHLPFALIPFGFCMFVLVQGLASRGWVSVFAYGWDHWVRKTGTVGAIGGMAFLSVIMCNFAGTNIGTSILLCRVVQAWLDINKHAVQNGNANPITNREFWGTVYSMAVGVNYGAFSTAFSASLAGMLWRDILQRKYIHVQGLEFCRVNLRIIAAAMVIGTTVLIGEIYVIRSTEPFRGLEDS